jgi:hypothetical protein
VSFSNYLENKLLDHVLRNVAYTSPSTVYIALYTSDPGEANSGTEVSGTAYARTVGAWGAAASGQSQNSGSVTFPTAGGSWGTITHFAVFDASTSGNMLVYGALGGSVAVASGTRPTFDTATLTVTLD